MTSALERVVRNGFEDRVPRTPDEFATVWKNSPERAALVKEVDDYNNTYTLGGEHLQSFQESRRVQQSKHQRVSSPYTLSYVGQVKLCLRRGFWRLKGDPSLTFTQLFGNFMMALIIGSVFFNLPQTTNSFYSRSAMLFFAVLLNAFGSALEVCVLKRLEFVLTHPRS
jgi:ATP-binding cassette subfamily G (WHITE) protein 2 (PDR)